MLSKVFTVNDYKVYQNHSQFIKDNNITPEDNLRKWGEVFFYDKEFVLSKIERCCRDTDLIFIILENPLQFNIDLTKEYINLIPEGYDYLEVDPMKVLHTEDE